MRLDLWCAWLLSQVCPSSLAALIDACWAAKPSDRPSCSDVVAQLQQLLDSVPSAPTTRAPSPAHQDTARAATSQPIPIGIPSSWRSTMASPGSKSEPATHKHGADGLSYIEMPTLSSARASPVPGPPPSEAGPHSRSHSRDQSAATTGELPALVGVLRVGSGASGTQGGSSRGSKGTTQDLPMVLSPYSTGDATLVSHAQDDSGPLKSVGARGESQSKPLATSNSSTA